MAGGRKKEVLGIRVGRRSDEYREEVYMECQNKKEEDEDSILSLFLLVKGCRMRGKAG